MKLKLDDDRVSSHQRMNLTNIFLFRKRLWPYIHRFKGLFFGSVFLVLVTTMATLITPWLLGYWVDKILVAREFDFFLLLTFLILGANLIEAFSSYAQNYRFSLLAQVVLHDLRQDLLKKYQFYPLPEFNRTPSGRLVTRLINDISNLQDLFTSGLAVALGNVAIVLGIMIGLVILNPRLGLICISVFPIMILLSRFFGRRIRKVFHLSRSALSRLNAFLAENISGMWIIQIFNHQNDFKERFHEISHDYTRTQVMTIESFAYFQPTITVLSSLSMSFLIWFGSLSAIEGTVSIGLLVTFMAYLHALYAPIRDITEKYNLFLTAMTSCERIFEFMDRPEEEVNGGGVVVPKLEILGRVEFQNVWASYDGMTSWALKDISFSVSPGEHIGIVGYTGAGKTTLGSLFLRFYEFQKGRILVDGRDITTLGDRRSLRQAIGYIQQEPFLFSGTVGDNIFLWERERYEAFRALPSIARLPFEQGQLPLDKEIYEKGANLSTGERQIIAFLRTLVQKPSIFILDEPTAHLDSVTEDWVQKVSMEVFQGRTVFIIAHRLSTLKSVNQIWVLHHGELVEVGTHAKLMSRGGVYQKLYEIQSRKDSLEKATTA